MTSPNESDEMRIEPIISLVDYSIEKGAFIRRALQSPEQG
jgi:hypothetical protein